MSKNTIWFEVEEHETISECLERMKAEGYAAVGRKEEPLFEEINGQPVPIRQIVRFKGSKLEQ
ncbi:NETI motif-containing protein [Planococcus sp. CPCC 101016]|uniref:NETI motif-containing protein n=1 Tax=Planococcus sp. CPCC 101016 TaxID=2599617 RepID=UPI0011B76DBD|nr:NETI motif-containing protein [Planococcus sp. CPCC 101016]TWT02955.1 NETI motif-containing protein [Planococcus sp. CPCC 101016]